MAKRKRKNKKKSVFSWLAVCVVLALSVAVYFFGGKVSFIPTWEEIFDKANLSSQTNVSSDGMTVTFLDVGQGDCTIISVNGETAVIDGGEKENAAKIVEFLKSNNVEKIDYVFATHPHSDHIGSLPSVINEMTAENVVMPKLPDSLVPTTKIYRDFIDAADKNAKTASYASVGDTYKLSDAQIEVLGPVGTPKDLNNSSLVLKVTYGTTSFLITGDCEESAEKKILSSRYASKLDSDVLKVGHHGSATSSSKAFINFVTPKYAVISCGADNSYGHPENETLKTFKEMNIDVFRTDLNGTVTCVSNGKTVEISVEKGE